MGGHPLPQPAQPVPAAPAVWLPGSCRAVVDDGDVQRAVAAAERHPGGPGGGVPQHVSQALLDDAVRGQFKRGGQRTGRTVDGDRQPGPGREFADPVQAGRRVGTPPGVCLITPSACRSSVIAWRLAVSMPDSRRASGGGLTRRAAGRCPPAG